MANAIVNAPISFDNPGLDVRICREGDEFVFTITAEIMARFVELKLTGADTVFSDNYFDVPAGREVRVTCPIPDGWTLEKAADVLIVYSLYDSFA